MIHLRQINIRHLTIRHQVKLKPRLSRIKDGSIITEGIMFLCIKVKVGGGGVNFLMHKSRLLLAQDTNKVT